MGDHAKLSPSSASRWMACPASIRLANLALFADGGSSFPARQGTAAHELASMCLEQDIQEASSKMDLEIIVEGETFVVDDEMAEAVQVYLDFVRERRKDLGDGCRSLIEQRVNLAGLDRSDIFGTADCMLVALPKRRLEVYDYKHGSGVLVEIEGNPQTRLYALGAMLKAGGPDLFDEIVCGIIQPRARHSDGAIRTESITPAELMSFGNDVVEAAVATEELGATAAAGKHCKWCVVAPTCKTLAGYVQEAAMLDFAEPFTSAELAVPEETEALARALEAVPVIDAWCKAVQGAAMRELEAGRSLPGFKLVRKKSNRAWVDAEVLEKALREKGVKVGDFRKPGELKTPAQMEKLKAVGKEFVRLYAHKPQGGLTMADETDPRDAIVVSSVEEDFADTPAE